ncbi:MAG: alpha/beta fold hydrolase [Pyrinomonadaceae bacterium]
MPKTTVRGIEVAYTDEGAGAPVVLLHGFPFNRSMWREQVGLLRGTHRVIAPDLRGHGDTGVAADGPATMEDMAEDVAALLDQLGIQRAILGALSMGGYVTFAFYRRHPHRVRALVLADTRSQSDADEARVNREKSARQALDEGMGVIAEQMIPKLFAPATLAERPEVVGRVREMIEGTNPAGAAAALRGMAVRKDQTEFLADILAPTLVMVGSEDTVTPPKDAELLHREIRGSRLVTIEGTGHVSNIERSAEFNQALADFLRALEP